MTLVILFWFPLLVFGFLNLKLVLNIVETDNFEQLDRAAEIQSASVDQFIKSNYEQINSFSNSTLALEALEKKDNHQRVIKLADLNIVFPLYLTGAFVMNKNGDVLASYKASGLNSNKSDNPAVQDSLEKKRQQLYVSSHDKISPEIMFAAPILNERNEVRGSVLIKYSLTVLQQVIGAHHDLMGDGSYGLILDNQDHVIASTKDFDLGFESLKTYEGDLYETIKKIRTSLPSKAQQPLAYTPTEGYTMSAKNIGKEQWISTYIQVPNSRIKGFSTTINNVFFILALVLLLATLSTAVIFILVRKLQGRETELKRANEEILADLILGNKVQKALQYVPKLPKELEFRWHQKAAKHVSGDLCFSYWNNALQVFTFMLIDVNGKGVQAALKAAAFSSIAKSVWTSRDSYKEGTNRFDIFVAAANRFTKSTDFQNDFLAVVAGEYKLTTNEVSLYRLNYTPPFLINLNPEEADTKVKRIQITNNTIKTLKMTDNQALMLLGDAFVESSRSEKKIMREIQSRVDTEVQIGADQLAKYILDWHNHQDHQLDDQTIMVLKKVA